MYQPPGPSVSHQAKLQLGEFLLNSFKTLFDHQPTLAEIHRQFGSDQKLRILCYQVSEYPTLIEAIRSTANHSQTFLDHALFTSWFSFLIADQMKLSVTTTKALFIAGLSQDLAVYGLDYLRSTLNTSSESGYVSGEASSDEVHLLTVMQFLAVIPRLPDGVGLLVLDHHEQYDGLGVPNGKREQQLPVASQVLIVANEVARLVYRNSQFEIGRALPVLKLNGAVYFKEVYRKAIEMVKGHGRNVPPVGDIHVPALLDMQNRLSLRWPHVLKATAELIGLEESRTIIGLRSLARRAWMGVTTAGVLSDELAIWLSEISSEIKEHEIGDYPELLEAEILLGELDNMLVRFQQLLEQLVQKELTVMDDAKRTVLQGICEQLGEQEETFDLEEFTLLNMCD